MYLNAFLGAHAVVWC